MAMGKECLAASDREDQGSGGERGIVVVAGDVEKRHAGDCLEIILGSFGVSCMYDHVNRSFLLHNPEETVIHPVRIADNQNLHIQ